MTTNQNPAPSIFAQLTDDDFADARALDMTPRDFAADLINEYLDDDPDDDTIAALDNDATLDALAALIATRL